MAPRLAQSPLKCGVHSGLSQSTYEKDGKSTGWRCRILLAIPTTPDIFFFLGSKKSLGHFPDLNWFGVSSQCSSHSKLWKLWWIHFNEEQKLSTIWGISILVGRKNRSNNPMPTSTLTSRLLFSKKKVASKPTKSLHKRPFHKKNWGIPIYIYIKWEPPTGKMRDTNGFNMPATNGVKTKRGSPGDDWWLGSSVAAPGPGEFQPFSGWWGPPTPMVVNGG